uniref:Uncharacterized protein n=1 Tax=Hyaloperonospora arabidopsidis (strain Emoy2) TaxID=559515 RepID=M4C0T9_HYAAE
MPPDEVTCLTSFHTAVVQQSFDEDALTTAIINQWMKWTREHILHRLRGQSDAVSQLDRVMCEDLEHEIGRRLDFSWQCEPSELRSGEGQSRVCLCSAGE